MIRKKRPGAPRRGPADIPADQWRNRGYLKFLKERGECWPCVSIRAWWDEVIDPAHGPTNGMRSKGPDAEAIPLCRKHHQQQHLMGWPEFDMYYRFSRAKEAAKWWHRYQQTRGVK